MSILDGKIDNSLLADFQNKLKAGASSEATDPAPILSWLNELREKTKFESHLVNLSDLQGWSVDADTGNIGHSSGQFFTIEGTHTKAQGLREVSEWGQPIFTQIEGGILALISCQIGDTIQFLLHAKAEPGNIGYLQIAPSLQCTHSNLSQAHQGKMPPLSAVLAEDTPGKLIYSAEHNEEGGRFWRKSNINCIIFVDNIEWLESQLNEHFIWASLSQIKALCLQDNIISPFVKTIIAPI
jgi:oxidase EvaA|tara:strand:+ start:270 stop:989 length:720 start_codon:yes stop_codon:yes gene_type:complete